MITVVRLYTDVDTICAFLQAVHKCNELADGSLLTFRHIHLHLYSATAQHEHEAQRNANDTAFQRGCSKEGI